jgi:hypothetical protein
MAEANQQASAIPMSWMNAIPMPTPIKIEAFEDTRS